MPRNLVTTAHICVPSAPPHRVLRAELGAGGVSVSFPWAAVQHQCTCPRTISAAGVLLLLFHCGVRYLQHLNKQWTTSFILYTAEDLTGTSPGD